MNRKCLSAIVGVALSACISSVLANPVEARGGFHGGWGGYHGGWGGYHGGWGGYRGGWGHGYYPGGGFALGAGLGFLGGTVAGAYAYPRNVYVSPYPYPNYAYDPYLDDGPAYGPYESKVYVYRP